MLHLLKRSSLVVVLGCWSCLGGTATLAATDVPAINARVQAALQADLGSAARHIEVDSFGGTVQLSGTVDSRSTGDRAIRIAADVAGVNHVENAFVRE
jgi:osmotically-inducible protein OsmY